MENPLTYYYTLKYLKPSQIVQRLRRRLMRPELVGFEFTPALADKHQTWNSREFHRTKLLSEVDVEFLHRKGKVLDREGWNAPGQDKLWLYNLHYFDDLNTEGATGRRGLQAKWIARWIDENRAGHGVGWEPYPTSLRIVNWVKAFLGNLEPSMQMLSSLGCQAQYLSKDLEFHLRGNHLFANAKALIFAGCYFQGDYPDRWFSKGMNILVRELEEQVLDDGGNFELSPMYHAIMLHDILDLINIAQVYPKRFDNVPVNNWRRQAQKMLRWLSLMSHPDGDIAFFNDAATGVAPTVKQLADYAEELGVTADLNCAGINHLPNSGYIRIGRDPIDLMIDAAPLGPDYLPGHAHADTLSFELSLHGQRLFVNSGTSEYGVGEGRLRQRKTAAHNTVEVDGVDSSEVWGGFRVARRAYPQHISLHNEADTVEISAAHGGYRRLPGKVTHRRRWVLNGDRLQVHDHLDGSFNSARAFLHLHPRVSVEWQKPTACMLQMPDGGGVQVIVRGGDLNVEPSTWHPGFGQECPSQRLVVTLSAQTLEMEIIYRT